MTWLLPAGFLALLALPALLLLRLAGARRRAHRVGALLLWEQAAQGLPRGSGRRLPALPLLLLELGALAALALGLAQPAWLGEAPALDVLVIVDRTASMQATGAGGTSAWQRGLQQLAHRTAQLPAATRYTVRAVPPLASGVLEGPRDTVLAVLATAAPDPTGFGDAVEAVGGEFHRYLLVTDRIPTLADHDALEVIATGEAAGNVALTQVRFETTQRGTTEPDHAPELELFAVVSNFTATNRDVALQLLRDGSEVGRATVSAAAGRAAGVVVHASDGLLDAALEGAIAVRIDHAGDALKSDDAIALERAPVRPLTLAWIGPESSALRRAIAAATGRRVVVTDGDGDGDSDAPDLTVCHRTVPSPLPSGAVLVVDPIASIPSLRWVRTPDAAAARPTGPHAERWTRLELPARWPQATGYSSEPVAQGGSAHAVDAGGRPVVWSSTRFGGQPIGVCGLPPEGGWELSPGYPIFWARILETLIDTGGAARAVQRDPAESDLRAATTRTVGGEDPASAPLTTAVLAGGQPWLVLLAIVLLALRLRRRP